MNEEHDGMDQGKPSEEEYQRFRKMMDSMGREDIRRMVEHLDGGYRGEPPRRRSPGRQGAGVR